ncbi:hypothetical protein PADK2_10870 [Pseudomonas aeruginosa DK2]|nr:hypothetical protein PADK2_10870 [Pseudomonas aeruginosa DK2]KFB21302.1 hypothetical protein PGPR2_13190 [Pseudomonas aeruginosa PGPR2]KSI50077.1 hypothetical protein AO985_25250 [Pseudomonas aeruginosa]
MIAGARAEAWLHFTLLRHLQSIVGIQKHVPQAVAHVWFHAGVVREHYGGRQVPGDHIPHGAAHHGWSRPEGA